VYNIILFKELRCLFPLFKRVFDLLLNFDNSVVLSLEIFQGVTHMSRVAVIASFALLCFSQFAAAAAPPGPDSHLTQLEQRAAKGATTAAGEYAKNYIDDAKASITDAKISIAAGKDKLAAKQIELADIQLSAADAIAAEKELLEKVAIRRSELKKMEARLERFRQGEEN
jgi:hypothetical protein